jgi:hypothetical protein
MKTRLTKAHKAALLAKLIPCIDLQGYEGYSNIYSVFVAEKDWYIAQVGELRAFEDWLRGLPTCSTITFTNYDIGLLWESLGVVGHDVDSYWHHAAVVLLAHAKSA